MIRGLGLLLGAEEMTADTLTVMTMKSRRKNSFREGAVFLK